MEVFFSIGLFEGSRFVFIRLVWGGGVYEIFFYFVNGKLVVLFGSVCWGYVRC